MGMGMRMREKGRRGKYQLLNLAFLCKIVTDLNSMMCAFCLVLPFLRFLINRRLSIGIASDGLDD